MGSSLVPHQTACLSRPRCSPRALTATHASAANVKVDLHLRECIVSHDLGLTYPSKDISEIAVEVILVFGFLMKHGRVVRTLRGSR